ncbi:hypothetical protein B6U99_01465 [Candidatus Geothermarchaeota archaeon ex4572_27]|nr:MAG: hypothetical protein B6U99_01465 [Candidatus Geothermarchaeota archaeon ex4572_27]
MDGDAAVTAVRVLALGRRYVPIATVMELAEGDPEDAVLDLYWWRVLIPVRPGVLEWCARQPSLSSDEVYEVPYAVALCFRGLVEGRGWRADEALVGYLKEISEGMWGVMAEAAMAAVGRARSYTLPASAIVEECLARGLESEDAGRLIAELKGGGFISPLLSLKLTSAFRSRQPEYEVNKAVFAPLIPP